MSRPESQNWCFQLLVSPLKLELSTKQSKQFRTWGITRCVWLTISEQETHLHCPRQLQSGK